jgi:hypothetical protein
VAARKKKPEAPEPEHEEPDFGSSRRISEAWAKAPEPWREVQAEQLSQDMSHLRDSDGDGGSEQDSPDVPRKRRFRLARLFSH